MSPRFKGFDSVVVCQRCNCEQTIKEAATNIRCAFCSEVLCTSCETFNCDGCDKIGCIEHMTLNGRLRLCPACVKEADVTGTEAANDALLDATREALVDLIGSMAEPWEAEVQSDAR